jgi:hypothetical protein
VKTTRHAEQSPVCPAKAIPERRGCTAVIQLELAGAKFAVVLGSPCSVNEPKSGQYRIKTYACTRGAFLYSLRVPESYSACSSWPRRGMRIDRS